MATSYFSLRGLDQQLDIARRTLTSRQQALTLREKRFRGGITSELDFRQAESEAAVAAAAVPVLAQQVQQAETALAILEENGHVQSQDGINTLGRPTVRYFVNPQIKKVAK